MKIIAQGDPVEYEVAHPADACKLYREDMTKALIGVVTHVTDYTRAQTANKRLQLALEVIRIARAIHNGSTLEPSLKLLGVALEKFDQEWK